MVKRFLQKLARRDDGTATIELALLAPLLATMIIGVCDISIAVGRRLELEQAAHRAIEKQMQTTGVLTVEDTIKKEAVCQINGTNDDGTCAVGRITTANVTVNYKLECSKAGVITTQESTVATNFEAFTCDTAAGEVPARYIDVVVTDSYTPLFSMRFGTGSDGIYELRAQAGMRVG